MDLSYLSDAAVKQAVVDMGPAAADHRAAIVDQARVYAPDQHTAHLDIAEPYSVEGDNAALRPDLVRRSRCCSGCIDELRRAVRVFV